MEWAPVRNGRMKNLLLVGGLAAAAFILLAALQPAEFRVTRSIHISAAPGEVFSLIDDLHRWKDWSPWAAIDANTEYAFSGPAAGLGATMMWMGNKDSGQGSLIIVESRPVEAVKVRMEFLKPYRAEHMADFSLQSVGDGTDVTWTVFGRRGLLTRGMGLFFDGDRIMGAFYESGLQQLRLRAEAARR